MNPMTKTSQALEMSKNVEKRYEMIQAHTKFGKPIRAVVTDYHTSIGTYYHWAHRFEKEGILGLIDKKRGAEVPHNKTPVEQEMEIIKIAAAHETLDAIDILDIVSDKHGFKGTVWTVERILRKHKLNRKKGKRSKKTIEKKKMLIRSQKLRLGK